MEERKECCLHTHCMSTLDAPMISSSMAGRLCIINTHMYMYMYIYIMYIRPAPDRQLVVRMRGRGTHSNNLGLASKRSKVN